jgi:tRNA-modifying protein YgfZ
MSDPTDDLPAEYDRFEREGGMAVLERDLVTVTGPDAGRYLQGQLSQEVVALPDGGSTWSLILQPTGKVDAWIRVHRVTDEEYVLDVDAGWGESLVARLNRFLLRTKAEVGAPEPGTMVAVRFGTGRVVLGDDDGSSGVSGPLSGTAVGLGVRGYDVVSRGRDAVVDGDQLVGPEAYERYRIAHGVPVMGAELTDDTIPAEAGQWLIDASVSFTKGCYTGQELVARIDSRGGNVPRPVRLLVVDGEFPVAPGAEVRAEGQPVGTVTSATPPLSPGHPGLLLAPLARSVAVGSTVEVETLEGWMPAGVVEPPFVGHAPA